jgi:hypothetical protein
MSSRQSQQRLGRPLFLRFPTYLLIWIRARQSVQQAWLVVDKHIVPYFANHQGTHHVPPLPTVRELSQCSWNNHPRQDIGITLQTKSVLASKNIFQTKLGQTISSLLFDSTSPQKYGKQVQHNLNGSDISPRSEKIALLRCRIIMSLSTTFCIFNSPLSATTERLQFLHSSYCTLATRRALLLVFCQAPLRLVIVAAINNIIHVIML